MSFITVNVETPKERSPFYRQTDDLYSYAHTPTLRFGLK